MLSINTPNFFLFHFFRKAKRNFTRHFICVIIFCLSAINSKAQQLVNKITADISSITTNAKLINRDAAISDTCKKKVNKLKNALPGNAVKKWSDSSVQNLISACDEFKSSIGDTNQCNNNKTIKFFLNYTAEFKKNLENLHDSLNKRDSRIPDIVSKNKISVKFIVNVVDSSTNKNIESVLNIDSSEISINRVLKKQTGFFEVTLFANNKYNFKINATKYNTYNGEFKIKEDQKDTIIKLKEVAQPVLTKSDPFTKVYNDEKVLLISSLTILFILIIVMIVMLIFYSNSRKNFSSVIASTGEIKNKINEPTKIMDDNNNTKDQSSLAAEKKNLIEVIPILNEESNDKKNTSASFICEIMMTAGPRKDDEEDKDLGEDVCGFVSNTTEVLFWLLDGTSNRDNWQNPVNKREYFSSRLLAQSLGNEIRKSFTKQTASLEIMFNEAVNTVITNWLSVFNNLNAEEQTALKNEIKIKKMLDCSTTILIAQLTLKGEFNAFRAGDSKLFLFGEESEKKAFIETPLAQKDDEDRIFFHLKLDEKEKFNLISNKVQYKTVQEKNVTAFISFSDGIGTNTEQKLKEEYINKPEEIRNDIIYDLQGTGDDKSICFIEIKQP